MAFGFSGERRETAAVSLVAGGRGIDGAGPGVDASGEGLSVVEALLAEPHGDIEGAGAVVAQDDDGLVGVELGEGAAGDIAHGHEEGVGEVGGVVFPLFADVEEQGRVGGLALLSERLRCDLGWEHGHRIQARGGKRSPERRV